MKRAVHGAAAWSWMAREEVHRRLTVVAIASLLMASTSPLLVRHLPPIEALLSGIDHIGALCVTALHLLFAPIHYVFQVGLAAGLLYAGWDRIRAWSHLRDVLGSLEAQPARAGDTLWSAAVEARLDPRRVRVVDGLPSPAFTVGLVAPRVYVAGSLAQRLSGPELVAVLAHESAHVARRDPLRLSLLRAIANTLFWIPVLRRLVDDMADEAEVRADDAAAAGRRLVLAQAILALAVWPEARGRPVQEVGFARPDLLDRRIRRLTGEHATVHSHVTRRSLVGALTALALIWGSALLMAHPFPASSPVAHERHCDHGHELAIAHLFCRGSPLAKAPALCPHRQGS